MGENILSMSTVVDRDTITLETKKHPAGEVYELVKLADLGPYEYAILANRNEEVQKLKTVKKPTPAQKQRTKKLLNELVKMVCPAIEKAVLGELTDEQKQWILLTWSARLEAAGAAEGNPTSRRTTAASPRGSRSSTAATRRRGSTRRAGR